MKKKGVPIMAKDYSRVQRGQVFWFNPQVYSEAEKLNIKGNEYDIHIQTKTRPVLVVSNNQNNDNSYTCNVIPITSEDKNQLPCHVTYNYAGKQQTILVEQIRTVDIVTLSDYICTLSDTIMQKVEQAMMSQFAIRPSVSYLDISMSNVTGHFQELIKKILVEQGAITTDKKQVKEGIPVSAIEDSALYLADTIDNLLKKPTPAAPIMEPSSLRSNAVKSEPHAKSPRPARGGRKVSEEEIRRRIQYVKDCNALALEDVARKYNVPLDKVLMHKYAYAQFIKNKGYSIK